SQVLAGRCRGQVETASLLGLVERDNRVGNGQAGLAVEEDAAAVAGGGVVQESRLFDRQAGRARLDGAAVTGGRVGGEDRLLDGDLVCRETEEGQGLSFQTAAAPLTGCVAADEVVADIQGGAAKG